MTTTSTLDHVLREVAATASAVDAGDASPIPHLRSLAASGLLDQGIEDLLAGSSKSLDVRASATTIASLAEECGPRPIPPLAERIEAAAAELAAFTPVNQRV